MHTYWLLPILESINNADMLTYSSVDNGILGSSPRILRDYEFF